MKLSAPDSWKIAEIGEISQIVSGGTPPSRESDCFAPPKSAIPWITPADLSGYRNKFISHGARDLTEKGLNSCSAKLMPEGSVLFSSRAPIGYVAIAENPISTNQGFKSFIFPHGIDNRFAYYQLRYITPEAEARATGTTFKELSGSAAAKLPFLVAPKEEQRRIADKLDTTLARVNALNDRLARIAPLLKRFRQSVLAAATSGRLTNAGENKITPIVLTDSQKEQLPKHWQWKTLQNIAKLESGHTPRKSVPEYWENGDVPWISLQDIRAADGTVIFNTKFMPNKKGIENSSARLLPKDTVCFCRDISFGFVTIMGREMATSQHFANWICGKDLLPKYLMYSFMAARDHLSLSGQGSTVTTIYMPALKMMQIAVPSVKEQTEIVRRVETLFAFADRLQARLQSAQTAAERLTPALLAKAFRGELVPQDPNDEPATELLRRLREARAVEAPAKPKRGRKSAPPVHA